jgi:hypothetical protein
MNISGNANTALVYLRQSTSCVNCVDAHESQDSGIMCNVITSTVWELVNCNTHAYSILVVNPVGAGESVACKLWPVTRQHGVHAEPINPQHISLAQHISISSRSVSLCMRYLYFDLSSAR